MSASSIVIAPDWVSVPERVDELSASKVPLLIAIVEARVPASLSFMDPAETVIAPDKVLPEAMETGVVWPTVRLLTVEFAFTSRPKLASEVLTLPTVIESSRSLLLALFNKMALVLPSVPPPIRVRVFAPRASPPVWLRVRICH